MVVSAATAPWRRLEGDDGGDDDSMRVAAAAADDGVEGGR
jgi:hypothetical protein